MISINWILSLQFKRIIAFCILLIVISIVKPLNAKQHHNADEIIYSRHKRGSGDILGKIKSVSGYIVIHIFFFFFLAFFIQVFNFVTREKKKTLSEINLSALINKCPHTIQFHIRWRKLCIQSNLYLIIYVCMCMETQSIYAIIVICIKSQWIYSNG